MVGLHKANTTGHGLINNVDTKLKCVIQKIYLKREFATDVYQSL
jgi:hypothetical protein